MATAHALRRRRPEGQEECQEVAKKVLRTRERSCIRVSSSHQNNSIAASFVTFEFGPQELNIYQYVADESEYYWKNAKAKFILKNNSEPKKGLLLIHEDGVNLETLCWRLFEFDPHTTSFSNVKWNSSNHDDLVCVIGFGTTFWKAATKANLDTLSNLTRTIDKSRLFITIEFDEDKQHALNFIRESQICLPTHVVQTSLDKRLLHETMYEILQRQLERLLSELKSRASTRFVKRLTTELDILHEKLLLRKQGHHISLSKQCLSKIKTGKEYGFVGHMLYGKILYIFEDRRRSEDAPKVIEIKKSIQDAFKGDVHYRSIRDVLSPHCASICGGPLQNSITNKAGTLGILGKLVKKETESSHEAIIDVGLSSGHVISAGTSALVSTLGEIGVCIWPASSSQNIHDVSIIEIDQERVGHLLHKLLLNEKISVEDIPKERLGYQPVIKYGARTGKTVGYVNVIDNFQMFENDVMSILPKKSECPNGLFSDKGDSGAIVLTRFGGKLYGLGVIYGGDLSLPECNSIHKDTIAVFLKRALDRFTKATKGTIILDKI